MKAKATIQEAWLTKRRISKLRQRLKRLAAKAQQYNVLAPKLTVVDSMAVNWNEEDYYRVFLEFGSESLGDIKHNGYTLRFNGILEVDKLDQNAFTIGNLESLAEAQVQQRYLDWCKQKKCLMCDHCGVGVWRKFVSEYIVLDTSDRLYFGTTCDQTVVGELIRLYLKVLDNWFNPSINGYLHCPLIEPEATYPSVETQYIASLQDTSVASIDEIGIKLEEKTKTDIIPEIEIEKKALSESSNIKDITTLSDGFYTVKTANNYVKGYAGKVLTVLGNKERYWAGSGNASELKPGQIFRKIGISDDSGNQQAEIHFIPCSCTKCSSGSEI